MVRHFLSLEDLDAAEIWALINRAIELKQMWKTDRSCPQIMCNRSIALLFEKQSTRTRLSFEVAAHQLGGDALFFAPADSQINRGESVADTARVLSGMVDLIVTRTSSHQTAETYAEHSSVPVINGLSDAYHPCQLLADLLTMKETIGFIDDATVAWVGDGNNMCVTWASAASLLGFRLRIATPEDYRPNLDSLLDKLNPDCIEYFPTTLEAADCADVVVTDTWLSMGQEDLEGHRPKAFHPFQVTQSVMDKAKPGAVFMHCLPAYRGKEVEAGVLDGPRSVVWQEAENRLHAQKALLEMLLRNQSFG